MTRPYALRRLLALGPLTMAELVEITRWPSRYLSHLLTRLQGEGIVEAVRIAPQRNQYRLAE